MLAFSSKRRWAQVQPHRAASLAVDSVKWYYSVLSYRLLDSLLVDLMKFELYPHLIASGESPGSKYAHTHTHTSPFITAMFDSTESDSCSSLIYVFCIHEDTIKNWVRPFVWCLNGLTLKINCFTHSFTLPADEANSRHVTVTFSLYECVFSCIGV